MRTSFELLRRYHYYLPYNHPISLFTTSCNQNVNAIMPQNAVINLYLKIELIAVFITPDNL